MQGSGTDPSEPSQAAATAQTETQSGERATKWQVANFRILDKVGEGGMGEVYRAEQEKPIRRQVALKLIKAGMDTKQVVARFESERQALALMSHPNIARVYEAGTTEQGRPYFVMEYVKGVPITQYCDKHRLTTNERLGLFMQVCEGVQHAHQKGIIHRDIKPSNVLVGFEDGKPVPKIIDFGVAKATEQRLTEKSLFTQLGLLIGTPEYMSPEQAEMTTLDIDTRTDVYSLGVLLYELLVGALPFEPGELRRVAFDEICRRIREEEPSKPSTRVSTLGEGSAESARRRKTDPVSLTRELRGDLDWITMKALEKDRTRRYPSPSEFAADVARHLLHEPVTAGPPSAVYRARKFARRHRLGVSFGTIVVLLLVALVVSMTIQSARIAKERDRANREAETAVREAETAEQVSEFLVGLFEGSDPFEAQGETITAREILDEGTLKIDRELDDQPLVQARLLYTMGRVYNRMGVYDRAQPMLEKAWRADERLLGPEDKATLAAETSLAGVYSNLGRWDEAANLFADVLEKRRRVFGDDPKRLYTALINVAAARSAQGRYEETEALYKEALELARHEFGDEDKRTLRLLARLAEKETGPGPLSEVEEIRVKILDTNRATLGREHPSTIGSMGALARVRKNQGRYDEAENLYTEALELARGVFGNEHFKTLNLMDALASLYDESGRKDEAERLYVEALELARRGPGDEHSTTLNLMNALASLYNESGRKDEAEPLMRETLETRKRMLGHDHRDTILSMANLANLYFKQHRYEEAEPLYLEALDVSRRVFGNDSKMTLRLTNNLAASYSDQGRYDEAEPLMRETLETQKRMLGHDHRDAIVSMGNLAFLYLKRGSYDEAEPLCLEVLRTQQRVLGYDHRDTLTSMENLGFLYQNQGRYDEAEPLILEALEIRKRTLGDSHPDTARSLYNLACLEAVRGDRTKAMDWLRQSVEAGFALADHMSKDSDLASLHGPAFDALVERARENASDDW